MAEAVVEALGFALNFSGTKHSVNSLLARVPVEQDAGREDHVTKLPERHGLAPTLTLLKKNEKKEE